MNAHIDERASAGLGRIKISRRTRPILGAAFLGLNVSHFTDDSFFHQPLGQADIVSKPPVVSDTEQRAASPGGFNH